MMFEPETPEEIDMLYPELRMIEAELEVKERNDKIEALVDDIMQYVYD